MRGRLVMRPRGRNMHEAEGERGQIIVLFTLVVVAILAFAALVVDLGLLRNDRQTLANAMDAGALAGGTLMPVDGSKVGAAAEVTALVNQTVQGTDPGLSTSDYNITYRCLIGTAAGIGGVFDNADINAFIPLDCDPSHALGHSPPVLGDFIGAGKTRSSDCRPDLGDKCNVVVVGGSDTTTYSFGPVVGVGSGNTGVVQSAACRGLCGELPDVPFDVVMVLDTSGSMQTNYAAGQPRIYWAKKAANQLLDSLEAAGGTQRVGAVGYSGQWNAPTAAVTLSDLTTDFPVVRAAIAPLSGAGNTPLKQGMSLGASVLTSGARSGVEHVLVVVSDGRPWPDVLGSARPTSGDIAAFRSSADQVYSVLIGPPTPGCTNSSACLDVPLMMSLAKARNGDDGVQDPSHFFHVVDASNLPDVFREIAVELTKPKSHLIQVYPAPIVTGVGGGATVSISGKYFTGATNVTFGGTPAAFTVNSDTSITATAPAGSSGATVHVRVTTQGGSSPAVSADLYTYP